MSNFRIPVIMMKIYIMIADAQALTDNAEHPEKVRQNIIQVALDYLACGIDPAEIYNLYSVYGTGTDRTDFLLYEPCYGMHVCSVTLPLKLRFRCVTLRQAFRLDSSAYPISQAADITAFRATHVPVGEDQMPMIEQCKEIVHKFNTVYGETLTDPKIVLPSNKACLRLPGIDGKAKMSKSLGNCIYLSDEEADVKKKIMSMFTDPNHLRVRGSGTA